MTVFGSKLCLRLVTIFPAPLKTLSMALLDIDTQLFLIKLARKKQNLLLIFLNQIFCLKYVTGPIQQSKKMCYYHTLIIG